MRAMSKFFIFIIFVGIFVFAANAQFTATNYVAPAGSDANGGTGWSDAWATISNAVALSSAGELILVSNGTYSINAQITMDKDVTVRGFSGDPLDTIVDAGGGNVVCFYITNTAPNAVVEALTVSNGFRGVYLDSVGTVRNCILTGHSYGSINACGAYCYYGGLVENCIIKGNLSRYASPGVNLNNGGIVRNSLIMNNTITGSGSSTGGGVKISYSGLVENCTVVSNYASASGGGIYISVGGRVTNSIIYNNDAPVGANFEGQYNNVFNNCIVTPLPTGGANNITDDPLFVDIDAENFKVLPGSAAINNGTNSAWMTTVTDLEGNIRISDSIVDIGCYEYTAGALDCNFTATPLSGLVPVDVVFTGYAAGTNLTSLHYYWDFDNDGSYDADGVDMDTVTNTYSVAGTFSAKVRVSNAAGEEDILLRTDYLSFAPPEVYVALNGNTSTYPYDTLTKAASNIQDAVDVAVDGTTVWINDGHYILTNGVSITIGATVKSINGRATTIIDGNQTVRCFYMNAENAVIDELTITNGYSDADAGGVYMIKGTLRNSDIVGNGKDGGGNTSGGVYLAGDGLIENCNVMYNIGQRYGAGGVKCEFGIISNCVITANVAKDKSAAGLLLYNATAYNCLIAGNKSLKNGTSVSVGYGGVSAGNSTLDTCTIVDNIGVLAGTTYGMGIYRSGSSFLYVRNCIIWNNIDDDTKIVYNLDDPPNGTFENNCTIPSAGTGGTTSDPRFIAMGNGYGLTYTNGDFQLQDSSPCIDTGTNQTWMTDNVDLNDANRIFNDIVDMGAYEWYPPHGTLILLR